MSTLSSNKKMTVKVFGNDGNAKIEKSIPNVTINFFQEYESLKKNISVGIHLFPGDPMYDINKMILKTSSINSLNGKKILKSIEITTESLLNIQNDLLQNNNDEKYQLYIKASQLVNNNLAINTNKIISSSRTSSRTQISSENQENEIKSNIIRPPSPSPRKLINNNSVVPSSIAAYRNGSPAKIGVSPSPAKRGVSPSVRGISPSNKGVNPSVVKKNPSPSTRGVSPTVVKRGTSPSVRGRTTSNSSNTPLLTKKSINFNNSPPLQVTNNKFDVKSQISNSTTPLSSNSLSSNSLSNSSTDPKTPIQEVITNNIAVVTPVRDIIKINNIEEIIIDDVLFTNNSPDYDETWTDVAGINSPSPLRNPLRSSSRSPTRSHMRDTKQLYNRRDSPHSMLSSIIIESNDDIIPSIKDDISNEENSILIVDSNNTNDTVINNNNIQNEINYTLLKDVEVLELNKEIIPNKEEKSNVKSNENSGEKKDSNDEINIVSRNISLSSSIKKLGITSPIPTKKFAKPNRKASMSAVLGRYNDEQLELIPSIYPNGGTGGELQTHIDRNMRQFRNKDDIQSNISNVIKPMTKIKNISDAFMSPKEKKHDDKCEGRPSIGTMQAEWDFILETNYGGNHEELQWVIKCKNAKKGDRQTYNYAHKMVKSSENKYFKSLNDIIQNEMKLSQIEGPLSAILTNISNEYQIYKLKSGDNSIDTASIVASELRTIALQKDLFNLLNDPVSDGNSIINSLFLPKTVKSIKLISESKNVKKVCSDANDIVKNQIPVVISNIKKSIEEYNKKSIQFQDAMDLWSKRESETSDYNDVLIEQEKEWFDKESQANFEALSIMRSYLPSNIASMSINDIMEAYKSEGGLVTFELATELKNNKLLQWLVLHTDDIATSSFLTGNSKNYFENIDILDIIELRAIACVLPSKFELDNDGKKNIWRKKFMTRVQLLVSQFNGDEVNGGWDSNTNKRSVVKLPPLKQDQLRRNIYSYYTKEVCDKKIKQYSTKEKSLQKKELLLIDADLKVKETKAEFDIILKEMRDPELKILYGDNIMAFTNLKEVAKIEKNNAEKNYKKLVDDIAYLRKSISINPYETEAFIKSFKDQMIIIFNENGIENWNELNQFPIIIEGVFDKNPEIIKMVRTSMKSLSVEEEAEQRKIELIGIKSMNNIDNTEVILNNDNELISNNNTRRMSTISWITQADNISNQAPITPKGRRNSIMDKHSDMVGKLNSIFSPLPSQGDNNNQVKILSPLPENVLELTKAAFGITENSSNSNSPIVLAKEIKKSQSKLLKKFMESQSNNNDLPVVPASNSSPIPPRPIMSMFDAIKLRRKDE